MKKTLVFMAMALITISLCVAQEDGATASFGAPVGEPTIPSSDLSLWIRHDAAGNAPIPWYVYSKDKTFVEARFNFDWKDSLTLFVGRNFTKGSFTITPEIGAMTGVYEGVSEQVYIAYAKDKWFVLMLNQLAQATQSGFPDFTYHWVTVNYRIAKPISIGFDVQGYYEYHGTPDAEWLVDLGPQVKLYYRQVYLKLWATRDPGHHDIHKYFVGLGYTF